MSVKKGTSHGKGPAQRVANIAFFTDAAQNDAIVFFAKISQCSKSEAIRRLIAAGLEMEKSK